LSEYLGIDILDSISCHTTLKANPAKLDMLLFISDKIKWDQKEAQN
jgi:HD superfamily phosphohydrolase YqeK